MKKNLITVFCLFALAQLCGCATIVPDVTVIETGPSGRVLTQRTYSSETIAGFLAGKPAQSPPRWSDDGYGARTAQIIGGVRTTRTTYSKQGPSGGPRTTITTTTQVGIQAEVSGRIVAKSGMHRKDSLEKRNKSIEKGRGYPIR
jgi:hypothetical protein